MDGDQAVLCSVNGTLAVSGVETCPRGLTCAALPSAFLDAAVGGIPSDLFSGKLRPCMLDPMCTKLWMQHEWV